MSKNKNDRWGDDPYEETFDESPNHGGVIKPKFIILHHSYGAHDGTVSWIKQDISNVSYHYIIDSDGSRTQMVWDKRRAWHAGKSRWGNYVGMNAHSIGIAFWGDTYNRDVFSAEIESCAYKCLYLMEKFNIQSLDNILTHQQVAPLRKNDPSPATHKRVLMRIRDLRGF